MWLWVASNGRVLQHVLFASLIIRLFQLVFSVGTVFFSHNKSAGTMFRLVFSAKRMGPLDVTYWAPLIGDCKTTVHV